MLDTNLTLEKLASCYYFYDALLIRKVEETLLRLFSEGLLNGTVHTCIGQEYSAVAFVKQLESDDFIFSNHRCHGHYLAKTGDYRGLIGELMGKRTGVCGGVGGSQHLYAEGFFSNGIQGGIVPVSAGLALANKLNGSQDIGIVFIGDGTLGEGVVYESLNILSKWEIPLLVVLENNLYAQSTHQNLSLSGDILARPRSFGIETFESQTSSVESLFDNARKSIEYVRHENKPAFHLVHTYRLAPHSKGDDLRDPAEIDAARYLDQIDNVAKCQAPSYRDLERAIDEKIEEAISTLKDETEQTLEEYYNSSEWEEKPQSDLIWNSHGDISDSSSQRMISRVNKAFRSMMLKEPKMIFLGEDILSPYGGAFKASMGLSDEFPKRVKAMPISEAAIVGIANGLALGGYRPFAELMFGDFLTLGMDQLVNHAAKFYHMYNKKISCPVVIRTPMGGGRGYGPTHSQTLDKLLLGVDNLKVVALNLLVSPEIFYDTILDYEIQPTVVIENKTDYARTTDSLLKRTLKYFSIQTSATRYPITKLMPLQSSPDLSIISYGGTLTSVIKASETLFLDHEILCELIILTQINPLQKAWIRSAVTSDAVFVVEEGSASGGFCSEVIASLTESSSNGSNMCSPVRRFCRLGSLPVAIPAAADLERDVLVSAESIVAKALEFI